jgi:alcohol dehydrogenase (NADP+)
MGRKSAAESVIGSIAETKVLLDFYGKHGITSDIEMIRIQDFKEALERILNKRTAYE